MTQLIENSKLLSKEAIIQVDSLFKKLRREVERLNYDLDKKVFQFPKLPKLLTESTCFYLIEEKMILKDIVFDKLGPGEVFLKKDKAQPSDLMIEIGDKKFPIEIKATASESRFSYLTENDVNAFILIFMDYYYYYQKGQPFVCVYPILNVSDYSLAPKTKKHILKFVQNHNIAPQRIDLNKLFQKWNKLT